jgi:hypothetical protein
MMLTSQELFPAGMVTTAGIDCTSTRLTAVPFERSETRSGLAVEPVREIRNKAASPSDSEAMASGAVMLTSGADPFTTRIVKGSEVFC